MITAWWWALAFVGSGYLVVLLATLLPPMPRKVEATADKIAPVQLPAGNKWLASYADDDTVINYDNGRTRLLRPISPSEPYATTLGSL